MLDSHCEVVFMCFQLGDEILTAGEDGDRGLFWLPGPGVTAECVDNNPAGRYHFC